MATEEKKTSGRLSLASAIGDRYSLKPIKQFNFAVGPYAAQTLYDNRRERPIRVLVRVLVPAAPEQGAPVADLTTTGNTVGKRIDLSKRGDEADLYIRSGDRLSVIGVPAVSTTDLTGITLAIEETDLLSPNPDF